jgi:hypothetical protein
MNNGPQCPRVTRMTLRPSCVSRGGTTLETRLDGLKGVLRAADSDGNRCKSAKSPFPMAYASSKWPFVEYQSLMNKMQYFALFPVLFRGFMVE